MAEPTTHAQQQLVGIRRRSTLGQGILLGGVTLGAIAAIVGLASLVNKLTYGTLFSNLNGQDVSACKG